MQTLVADDKPELVWEAAEWLARGWSCSGGEAPSQELQQGRSAIAGAVVGKNGHHLR